MPLDLGGGQSANGFWIRTIQTNPPEFYRLRHLTTNILDQAEKNYFCKLVHDNHTKTKKIFAMCNNLLGRSQDHPLPLGSTDKELAKCFSKYFNSNIDNIRDTLIAKQGQLLPPPVLHQITVPCMDSLDCCWMMMYQQ